jgi:hypothetical protein
VNVRSVCIETKDRDSSGHVTITETDFFSLDSTVAGHSAYSIWSLTLAASAFKRYVGAEIDGNKSSMPLQELEAIPSR